LQANENAASVYDLIQAGDVIGLIHKLGAAGSTAPSAAYATPSGRNPGTVAVKVVDAGRAAAPAVGGESATVLTPPHPFQPWHCGICNLPEFDPMHSPPARSPERQKEEGERLRAMVLEYGEAEREHGAEPGPNIRATCIRRDTALSALLDTLGVRE
jgi:hypothetical protein